MYVEELKNKYAYMKEEAEIWAKQVLNDRPIFKTKEFDDFIIYGTYYKEIPPNTVIKLPDGSIRFEKTNKRRGSGKNMDIY